MTLNRFAAAARTKPLPTPPALSLRPGDHPNPPAEQWGGRHR